MKKICSLLILFILFFTIPVYSMATINMNLEDSSSEDDYTLDYDYLYDDYESDDDYEEDETFTTSVEPQVQSIQTTSESSGMSLEVVCSIILSSIGLVLIFLAIAILIKIK